MEFQKLQINLSNNSYSIPFSTAKIKLTKSLINEELIYLWKQQLIIK